MKHSPGVQYWRSLSLPPPIPNLNEVKEWPERSKSFCYFPSENRLSLPTQCRFRCFALNLERAAGSCLKILIYSSSSIFIDEKTVNEFFPPFRWQPRQDWPRWVGSARAHGEPFCAFKTQPCFLLFFPAASSRRYRKSANCVCVCVLVCWACCGELILTEHAERGLADAVGLVWLFAYPSVGGKWSMRKKTVLAAQGRYFLLQIGRKGWKKGQREEGEGIVENLKQRK